MARTAYLYVCKIEVRRYCFARCGSKIGSIWSAKGRDVARGHNESHFRHHWFERLLPTFFGIVMPALMTPRIRKCTFISTTDDLNPGVHPSAYQILLQKSASFSFPYQISWNSAPWVPGGFISTTTTRNVRPTCWRDQPSHTKASQTRTLLHRVSASEN